MQFAAGKTPVCRHFRGRSPKLSCARRAAPLTIPTSRYQAREKIAASGLAPVGTTVGRPRFKLGYELAGIAGALAPHGLLHVEDRAEFEAAYRARLDCGTYVTCF